MDRASAKANLEFLCPDCTSRLERSEEGTLGVLRLSCPGCGSRFRAASPGKQRPGRADAALESLSQPSAGTIKLWWRALILRILERLYWSGTALGTVVLVGVGGLVPVLGRWLRNEIEGWPEVVEAVGGVWFRIETSDPDGDLGPVLARADAPQLFSVIEAVARRLGVRPPSQIRLTYLPCCGVVAWGRSRALIIGLPLLRVLTKAELRAVLAHELAHLARGDATRAARSARFVEGLEQAVARAGGRAWGPLGAWARFCLREAAWLIEPLARGQEARADRLSAMIAGGSTAASALVKVAMVQPLFREVLEHYDPTRPGVPNLYAFFRAFWYRLSPETHSLMRLHVLARRQPTHDPAHPPLPDRLAWLLAYPNSASRNGDDLPATSLLGDLEVFEQMLHNRLFGVLPVEPTVFHRAGS